jgi:ABC-type polysaccharide/polyol phosphate export permease
VSIFKQVNLRHRLEVPMHLGWRDLRSRYAQTKIGPWWSASSLFIIVIGISLSTGLLTGNAALQQAPKIAVAMGFWTFVSGVLTEATDTFVTDRSILLNTTISDSMMTVRLLWRNYLILLHNSIVIVIFLALSRSSPVEFFKVVVLMVFFAPFLCGSMFVPAFLFSRFGAFNRDLRVFLTTAIQLNFFITPILWDPPASGPMHFVFLMNPLGWAIQFAKEFVFNPVFPTKLLLVLALITGSFSLVFVVLKQNLTSIKKFL